MGTYRIHAALLCMAFWEVLADTWTAWTWPRRAANISYYKPGKVMFQYFGRTYRGHIQAHTVPKPYPWFKSIQRSMKKPTLARDGAGVDVTTKVQEYWGPAGRWNADVGLVFEPEREADSWTSPLTVYFNNGSISTYTW